VAYVYARGSKYWIRYKDIATKKWISDPTTFLVSDSQGKVKAQRSADKQQGKLNVKHAVDGPIAPAGPLTVRAYAEGTWIEERRAADLDWKNDLSRLRHHVLPAIGHLEVGAPVIVKLFRDLRFPTALAKDEIDRRVRAFDLRMSGEKLSRAIKAKRRAGFIDKLTKGLAPRSIYNVYSVVAAMLRDAELAGLIERAPAKLDERQLGPLVDKDREWRSGAVFSRDEAEILISDERIPFDRRLYYAFELLAGMRPGEIAALRWSRYEPSSAPLGRLTVAVALNRKGSIKGTKTNSVRSFRYTRRSRRCSPSGGSRAGRPCAAACPSPTT
jgi:hypothetical protein